MAGCFSYLTGFSKGSRVKLPAFYSLLDVVNSNTLNLDPDPELWSNFDPDPVHSVFVMLIYDFFKINCAVIWNPTVCIYVPDGFITNKIINVFE